MLGCKTDLPQQTLTHSQTTKRDSIHLSKKVAAATAQVSIGRLNKFYVGDFYHLTLTFEDGTHRDFFVGPQINENTLEKLESDKSLVGLKIKVNWIRKKIQLPQLEGMSEVDMIISIDFLEK